MQHRTSDFKYCVALLTTASLSWGAISAWAQTAFTDVTTAAGVAHTSETYGASWGDLNGDGFPDLFVSNHRTQPSLYLNMGDGTFIDVASQTMDWVNHKGADTHGAAWADFNNDGDQDLLVSTGRGNLSQWLVNDGQRLVDRTIGSGLDVAGFGGRMPLWVDYNNDHLLDVVMANYAGTGKVFRQNANGTFTETTGATTFFACVRFLYTQLMDVNGDGRLDVLCPAESKFPQKIFNTSTIPWTKLFDSAAPAPFFPIVKSEADSVVADFNNDGRMDMFVLGGVVVRPSSVDQTVPNGPAHPNNFEALLIAGSKGLHFVTTGTVTFTINWNKTSESVGTDIKRIQIGAGGTHPTAGTFTLDPADPTVAGMPPTPTDATLLPLMQIGFDPVAHRWTLSIVTKLVATDPNLFSQGYIQGSSTAPITGLQGTGLWTGDKPARPTLLMNQPNGTFVDQTVAAHLDTPVQCSSVTAGDFDNDMYVDLYLACRTGASNIANILYHNNGDGTFTAVPNAGGAAGPIGLGLADGAGWADSVVTADYDVDGFLDLFVTNGFNLQPAYVGGPNKLFHNKGNANHWIELDLVGVNSDRDATGARVYASANGVTQLRVQDGRIHRWSQDSKRIHFGLAGALTVNLTVKWPSGVVQTFPNVTANRLYKITENAANPVPVAVGVAPVYPCGPPALNAATDTGVFVWRDCPSGEWRLKTASAGGNILYTGTLTSSATYLSVKPIGLSGSDSLDYTTNPEQVAFSFHTIGTGTDGFIVLAQDGTSNCLKITAPGITQVHFGPFRVPLSLPIELGTQLTCP